LKRLVYILFLIFLFSNTTAQISDTVKVGNTVTYKVHNHQFASWLYWEITNGEILSDNPTQQDSIVVLWNIAGIQTLSVYEETPIHCVGELTSTKIMVIENDYNTELEIPNIFTPNDDGINDYFVIRSILSINNYGINIFNRWGVKVFESNDIKRSWDGYCNGDYCSAGVYYFVIRYGNGANKKERKGFLHLIR